MSHMPCGGGVCCVEVKCTMWWWWNMLCGGGVYHVAMGVEMECAVCRLIVLLGDVPIHWATTATHIF